MENTVRRDIVQIEFESNLKELTKVTKELDEVKKAAGLIDDQPIADLGDEAKQSDKKVKFFVKSLKNTQKEAEETGEAGADAFDKIKDAIKTAGAALTASVLLKGATDTQRAFNSIQAQTGATAKEMQEYKQIAKDLYKQNMGEDMYDIADALSKVRQVTNQSGDALKDTTQNALLFRDTFGFDVTESVRTADMLVKQFGLNANDAYNLIAQGAQNGLNKNDDLLDTINEYSVHYKKLGFNSEEMMNSLIAGAETGTFSVDKLGDTIKEFSIRVIDGSDSTASGFQSIGLNADQMAKEFAAGGDTAQEAFQKTIKAILNTEDPIKQDAAGVALFGTMWEDLGVKGVTSMAEVTGAVNLGKDALGGINDIKYDDAMSALSSLGRTINVELAGSVGTIVNKIKPYITEFTNGLTGAAGTAETACEKIGAAFKFVLDNINWIAPAVLGVVGSFKALKGIKSISSTFGSLFGSKKGKQSAMGEGKTGGSDSGIFGMFKNLANIPVKTTLKGVANLSILLGALGALVWIASKVFKGGIDFSKMLQVITLVGVLGAVGLALTKVSGIVGAIPIPTVLKGLANMAVVLTGLGALLWVAAFAFKGGVAFGELLQVVALIGILGAVGTALSVFAGAVGLIPIPIVLSGLVNIGLVMGGLGALLWAATGVFSSGINFSEMLQIVTVIGVLGTVGSLLSGLAGVIGLIPFPLVLSGLVNIGLVFIGLSALITKSKGFFNEVATFSDAGFTQATKMFDCLAGLKSLPKDGGIVGWFKGNIDYQKIASGLGSLSSSGAKRFFEMAGSLKAATFSNTTKLFKSLAGIGDLPESGGIKGWFNGDVGLGDIADDLSYFADTADNFFVAVNGLNLENLNGLWTSLRGAGTISTDVSKVVDENINGIVSKIKKLPKQMADGIKSSGAALANAFVAIWTDAVKATAKPVNKLLSGANFVLQQFGSAKRVASWVPYANGTSGHKGGNALVNDGRGAELVQMPNGNTFIPHGRNVLMPNAPRGMKVLSAEKTARLFGKPSPTFRYASGTGNFDVWQYMDNAASLINAIKNNFVSYGDIGGIAVHFGKSMVSTITNEMSGWAKKLFEEFGALPLSAYNPSKGVEQWRSTVIRALKMEGLYSEANVLRTLYQMQTESSGNPRAINLWDINAKNGVPSKGLMQVIDPTFRAYARPGFNQDIYDPLSNILASIRYAKSRYGSLERAYRGVGYENGVGKISSVSLPAYTPESKSTVVSATSVRGGDTYAPVFNLTVNSTGDDRTTARKVKQWVKESMDEIFDSMARRNPRLREV